MNIKEKTDSIYKDLNISNEVLSFCNGIINDIQPRFTHIDNIAEYNQMKVIKAMQTLLP